MFVKYAIFVVLFVYCFAFEVPEAKFEVLRPRGFRVSIPDVEGIKLFAFHAKLNEELNGREGGTFSRDITKAKNGRWTFYDPYTVLNVGDILYYWTYVDYFDGRNKLGYTNDDQHFIVTNNDIVQISLDPTRGTTQSSSSYTPTPTRPPLVTESIKKCEVSKTKFNNGIRSCKRELIFSEDFDSLDIAKWTREVKFAGEPDYEFVVYTTAPEVLKVEDGYLSISPVLSSSLFGDNFETSPESYDLGSSCTGKAGTPDCSQAVDAFVIRPPVASALITTKNSFSFVYGKIEVNAKLPKGDWIYPVLYLNPKNEEYGDNYQSGQIRIAFLPGNSQFSNVVYGGCILGLSNDARTYGMKPMRRTSGWSNEFHKFAVEWYEDRITLTVNHSVYGHIYPPEGGFASLETQLDLKGCDRWRSSNSILAPFDKEMYIAVGVGVGGDNFPDQNLKPWSNDDPKRQKKFFKKKSQWYSTWSKESALKIDHIYVYADPN